MEKDCNRPSSRAAMTEKDDAGIARKHGTLGNPADGPTAPIAASASHTPLAPAILMENSSLGSATVPLVGSDGVPSGILGCSKSTTSSSPPLAHPLPTAADSFYCTDSVPSWSASAVAAGLSNLARTTSDRSKETVTEASESAGRVATITDASFFTLSTPQRPMDSNPRNGTGLPDKIMAESLPITRASLPVESTGDRSKGSTPQRADGTDAAAITVTVSPQSSSTPFASALAPVPSAAEATDDIPATSSSPLNARDVPSLSATKATSHSLAPFSDVSAAHHPQLQQPSSPLPPPATLPADVLAHLNPSLIFVAQAMRNCPLPEVMCPALVVGESKARFATGKTIHTTVTATASSASAGTTIASITMHTQGSDSQVHTTRGSVTLPPCTSSISYSPRHSGPPHFMEHGVAIPEHSAGLAEVDIPSGDGGAFSKSVFSADAAQETDGVTITDTAAAPKSSDPHRPPSASPHATPRPSNVMSPSPIHNLLSTTPAGNSASTGTSSNGSAAHSEAPWPLVYANEAALSMLNFDDLTELTAISFENLFRCFTLASPPEPKSGADNGCSNTAPPENTAGTRDSLTMAAGGPSGTVALASLLAITPSSKTVTVPRQQEPCEGSGENPLQQQQQHAQGLRMTSWRELKDTEELFTQNGECPVILYCERTLTFYAALAVTSNQIKLSRRGVETAAASPIEGTEAATSELLGRRASVVSANTNNNLSSFCSDLSGAALPLAMPPRSRNTHVELFIMQRLKSIQGRPEAAAQMAVTAGSGEECGRSDTSATITTEPLKHWLIPACTTSQTPTSLPSCSPGGSAIPSESVVALGNKPQLTRQRFWASGGCPTPGHSEPPPLSSSTFVAIDDEEGGWRQLHNSGYFSEEGMPAMRDGACVASVADSRNTKRGSTRKLSYVFYNAGSAKAPTMTSPCANESFDGLGDAAVSSAGTARAANFSGANRGQRELLPWSDAVSSGAGVAGSSDKTVTPLRPTHGLVTGSTSVPFSPPIHSGVTSPTYSPGSAYLSAANTTLTPFSGTQSRMLSFNQYLRQPGSGHVSSSGSQHPQSLNATALASTHGSLPTAPWRTLHNGHSMEGTMDSAEQVRASQQQERSDSHRSSRQLNPPFLSPLNSPSYRSARASGHPVPVKGENAGGHSPPQQGLSGGGGSGGPLPLLQPGAWGATTEFSAVPPLAASTPTGMMWQRSNEVDQITTSKLVDRVRSQRGVLAVLMSSRLPPVIIFNSVAFMMFVQHVLRYLHNSDYPQVVCLLNVRSKTQLVIDMIPLPQLLRGEVREGKRTPKLERSHSIGSVSFDSRSNSESKQGDHADGGAVGASNFSETRATSGKLSSAPSGLPLSTVPASPDVIPQRLEEHEHRSLELIIAAKLEELDLQYSYEESRQTFASSAQILSLSETVLPGDADNDSGSSAHPDQHSGPPLTVTTSSLAADGNGGSVPWDSLRHHSSDATPLPPPPSSSKVPDVRTASFPHAAQIIMSSRHPPHQSQDPLYQSLTRSFHSRLPPPQQHLGGHYGQHYAFSAYPSDSPRQMSFPENVLSHASPSSMGVRPTKSLYATGGDGGSAHGSGDKTSKHSSGDAVSTDTSSRRASTLSQLTSAALAASVIRRSSSGVPGGSATQTVESSCPESTFVSRSSSAGAAGNGERIARAAADQRLSISTATAPTKSHSQDTNFGEGRSSAGEQNVTEDAEVNAAWATAAAENPSSPLPVRLTSSGRLPSGRSPWISPPPQSPNQQPRSPHTKTRNVPVSQYLSADLQQRLLLCDGRTRIREGTHAAQVCIPFTTPERLELLSQLETVQLSKYRGLSVFGVNLVNMVTEEAAVEAAQPSPRIISLRYDIAARPYSEDVRGKSVMLPPLQSPTLMSQSAPDLDPVIPKNSPDKRKGALPRAAEAAKRLGDAESVADANATDVPTASTKTTKTKEPPPPPSPPTPLVTGGQVTVTTAPVLVSRPDDKESSKHGNPVEDGAAVISPVGSPSDYDEFRDLRSDPADAALRVVVPSRDDGSAVEDGEATRMPAPVTEPSVLSPHSHDGACTPENMLSVASAEALPSAEEADEVLEDGREVTASAVLQPAQQRYADPAQPSLDLSPILSARNVGHKGTSLLSMAAADFERGEDDELDKEVMAAVGKSAVPPLELPHSVNVSKSTASTVQLLRSSSTVSHETEHGSSDELFPDASPHRLSGGAVCTKKTAGLQLPAVLRESTLVSAPPASAVADAAVRFGAPLAKPTDFEEVAGQARKRHERKHKETRTSSTIRTRLSPTDHHLQRYVSTELTPSPAAVAQPHTAGTGLSHSSVAPSTPESQSVALVGTPRVVSEYSSAAARGGGERHPRSNISTPYSTRHRPPSQPLPPPPSLYPSLLQHPILSGSPPARGVSIGNQAELVSSHSNTVQGMVSVRTQKSGGTELLGYTLSNSAAAAFGGFGGFSTALEKEGVEKTEVGTDENINKPVKLPTGNTTVESTGLPPEEMTTTGSTHPSEPLSMSMHNAADMAISGILPSAAASDPSGEEKVPLSKQLGLPASVSSLPEKLENSAAVVSEAKGSSITSLETKSIATSESARRVSSGGCSSLDASAAVHVGGNAWEDWPAGGHTDNCNDSFTESFMDLFGLANRPQLLAELRHRVRRQIRRSREHDPLTVPMERGTQSSETGAAAGQSNSDTMKYITAETERRKQTSITTTTYASESYSEPVNNSRDNSKLTWGADSSGVTASTATERVALPNARNPFSTAAQEAVEPAVRNNLHVLVYATREHPEMEDILGIYGHCTTFVTNPGRMLRYARSGLQLFDACIVEWVDSLVNMEIHDMLAQHAIEETVVIYFISTQPGVHTPTMNVENVMTDATVVMHAKDLLEGLLSRNVLGEVQQLIRRRRLLRSMVDVRMEQSYQIVSHIGSGAFGDVFEVLMFVSRGKLAMKRIFLKSMKLRQLEIIHREVSIMRALDHPNIVFFSHTRLEDNAYAIFMELCDGTLADHLLQPSVAIPGAAERQYRKLSVAGALADLAGTTLSSSSNSASVNGTDSKGDAANTFPDRLGPGRGTAERSPGYEEPPVLTTPSPSTLMRPQDAVMIIHDIASALKHLHHRGIIHRDVKPANVLFANGIAKLGDFGSAVKMSESRQLRNMKGTVSYMAPEMVLGEPYTESCDLWSFGCLIAGIMGINLGHVNGLHMPALHELYCAIPETGSLPLTMTNRLSSRFENHYTEATTNRMLTALKHALTLDAATSQALPSSSRSKNDLDGGGDGAESVPQGSDPLAKPKGNGSSQITMTTVTSEMESPRSPGGIAGTAGTVNDSEEVHHRREVLCICTSSIDVLGEYAARLPASLVDLFGRLFHRNPTKRMTAAEVLDHQVSWDVEWMTRMMQEIQEVTALLAQCAAGAHGAMVDESRLRSRPRTSGARSQQSDDAENGAALPSLVAASSGFTTLRAIPSEVGWQMRGNADRRLPFPSVGSGGTGPNIPCAANDYVLDLSLSGGSESDDNNG